MSNFEKSVSFTLNHEGGYVNDPKDPGGETKYGISKKAYPSLNIKGLTLDKAKEIYHADYWDIMGCDDYEWPLCLIVFDTAVNLGFSRTSKLLDKIQGTNPKQNALDLIKLRKQYYNNLITKRPSLSKFLKGWMNRIYDLEKAAFNV